MHVNSEKQRITDSTNMLIALMQSEIQNLEAVKLSLKQGADSNLVNSENPDSPFQIAVKTGRNDIAELLLTFDSNNDKNILADANIVGQNFAPPLYYIKDLQPRKKFELLKLLISRRQLFKPDLLNQYIEICRSNLSSNSILSK